MWIQSRQFTRLILVSLVSVCALAGAGYGAIQGYKNWKEKRLLRLTKEFMAQGRPRQAILNVQQAVANNPFSVDACRLMADVAEQCGSATAVFYRQRVVELQPATTNQVEWLKSAIKFSEHSAAQEALAQLTNSGVKTVAVHQAAADLFLAMRAPALADEHLAQALLLAPDDAALLFSRASLHLRQGSADKQSAAREQLRKLSAGGTQKINSLRLLTEDAIQNGGKEECFKLVESLLAASPTFPDRMLRLQAVTRFQPEMIDVTLQALQRECGADVIKLHSVASWMLNNKRTPEATAWLKKQPVESLKQLPLAVAYCECLVSGEEWNTLQKIVQEANWGRREAFRLALLSRALRANNNELGAKVEWRKALKAASMNLDEHLQLVRLTSLWRWESEQVEVLWQVVNTWPREKWAFLALSRILANSGHTVALQSLYARETGVDPENYAVRNNHVMVCLLLNPADKIAHDKARDLFRTHGTNAVVASTYCFSLLLQRQPQEALSILEKLDPQSFKDPSVAMYFGLALKACGRAQDARPYLELATQATLLPEERQLIQTALAGG